MAGDPGSVNTYPNIRALAQAAERLARKLSISTGRCHRDVSGFDGPSQGPSKRGGSSFELSQYDLLYWSKTTIKTQALEDFVAEFTPLAEEENLVSKKKESSRADKTFAELEQPKDIWQLRVDGASNQKSAGAGVVIITPDGTMLAQAITLGFHVSNNKTEYEALLVGLRLTNKLLSSWHLTTIRRPLFELQLTSSTPSRLRASLTSIVGKLLLEYELNEAFFKHYVPDIRSQATSLTSTEGRLLLEYKLHGVLSSVMFSTYVNRQKALPLLQASYFSSTNFMESFRALYPTNIHMQATSLISIADKLLLEYKLNGAFFGHYIPDIRSQATSLTSTESKLLLEYKLHGVFLSIMSPTYAHR
ncbi:hypothetical protein L3X38_018658 [Prunus dulcis]|uniref:RNase H type-1 domain-containing protein n=1 Tax=Prunus dulcis TaxID=3755 RepID=A0AAD4WA58_PRUDU|nr:hypothetical protein L3X38_018658 [Prunus dulcis]